MPSQKEKKKQKREKKERKTEWIELCFESQTNENKTCLFWIDWILSCSCDNQSDSITFHHFHWISTFFCILLDSSMNLIHFPSQTSFSCCFVSFLHFQWTRDCSHASISFFLNNIFSNVDNGTRIHPFPSTNAQGCHSFLHNRANCIISIGNDIPMKLATFPFVWWFGTIFHFLVKITTINAKLLLDLSFCFPSSLLWMHIFSLSRSSSRVCEISSYTSESENGV